MPEPPPDITLLIAAIGRPPLLWQLDRTDTGIVTRTDLASGVTLPRDVIEPIVRLIDWLNDIGGDDA